MGQRQTNTTNTAMKMLFSNPTADQALQMQARWNPQARIELPNETSRNARARRTRDRAALIITLAASLLFGIAWELFDYAAQNNLLGL